jgi:hypothetical protein
MRLSSIGFASLAALAVLVPASRAAAVGTRSFNLDTLEEMSGGDLKGVAVSSDGIVRAGWTFGNVPLKDATSAFCALAMDDDSVLIGSSPGGKILRVAGDQVTVFAETKELAVTALAKDKKGTVYAGTTGGKLFKVSQGKADVFSKLEGAEHVWALAFDAKTGSLFAATGGDEGKVFRVDAGGGSSVFFKSDEPHLVSVAVADNGDVLAGSSGKGLLYRIAGAGRGQVVYDFPGEEVKGIVVGARGSYYVIANEYGEPPEPPRKSSYAAHQQPGPSTGARPKPGKGALYRFDASGRPEKLMHHDEFHYLSLALGAHGEPLVGTGAEGRIYSADDDHVVTLVADVDSRQIGALGLNAHGKPFAVASDPAVYHRVVAQGGADSIWTSKTLDAGLRARFGHLAWVSSGAVEVSTRTGNTSTPDDTWSAWSSPMRAAGAVTSPAGRFVQVRARLTTDTTTLNEIVLPYLTENLRPIVTEVTAHQKGITREGKEGQSANETPKHETGIHISWKVDNADGDALRYRLWFRSESQTVWRDMLSPGEMLTKQDFDWDAAAIPEGRYRVRVDASDEMANPPDTASHHALDSSIVLIDNTPPVITGLGIAGRRLHARITDGLGPIVRAEIAVDGQLEWRPVSAADGIFDTADETIDEDVAKLVPAGSHVVALRAFDLAGNSAVSETEAK